jgi:hypothetical protein
MEIKLHSQVVEEEHGHEMVVCDVCFDWTAKPEKCDCGLVVCEKCTDWGTSRVALKVTCKRCKEGNPCRATQR